MNKKGGRKVKGSVGVKKKREERNDAININKFKQSIWKTGEISSK